MAESLGLTSEAYAFDNIVAGDYPIVSRSIELITGQNLVKGTVIGRITMAVGAATKGAGDTGNGVPGAVTAGDAIKLGVYTLLCHDASVSGSEIFTVFDPDGVRLEDLTIAVAFSNAHFGITIADGSADFIVGDSFTITVAAGSLKYTQALSASKDGSQLHKNMCILAKDTDATSADVTTTGWITGEYNENSVTFGTGLTYDNCKFELAKYGIFLKESLSV